jgi:hypothetical protein
MKLSNKIMFFLLAFTICASFIQAQTKGYKCLYLERSGISKDSSKQWEPVSTTLPKGGFQSMGSLGSSVDSLVNFLNGAGVSLNTAEMTRFTNINTGDAFLQLPFEQGELIIVTAEKKITEFFLVLNSQEGKLNLTNTGAAKSSCSSWALFQTYTSCGTSLLCRIKSFNPKTTYIKFRYKRTCSGNAQYFVVTVYLICGC